MDKRAKAALRIQRRMGKQQWQEGEAATDSLMSKDYHDDVEYMAQGTQYVEERLWREKAKEEKERKASEIH